MVQEYPIYCILGERGDGKTLTATWMAYTYFKVDKLPIYANYHIKKIPCKYITFNGLIKMVDAEKLKDCVVILDEVHIGADAYDFFKKHVATITTFTTQLRKLHITLVMTTQRFNMLPKRLRQMTNYTIQCEQTPVKGIVKIQVFDQSKAEYEAFIKEMILDGRPLFSYYDTDEIITSDIE